MTPHHPNQPGGPTDLPNQPVYYHTIISFAHYVQQASLLIPQKHQDFFLLALLPTDLSAFMFFS